MRTRFFYINTGRPATGTEREEADVNALHNLQAVDLSNYGTKPFPVERMSCR